MFNIIIFLLYDFVNKYIRIFYKNSVYRKAPAFAGVSTIMPVSLYFLVSHSNP